MEEAGHTGGDRGHDGWESDEGDRENGSSTEQLLQDAFASLSLHEKCALSLHVSHQQQGAAGKDAGATVGKDPSEELAGVEERGLREEDLRAIMSMMGPSDLSEVEDEVKVIQQNFRAWILRCNYKSLRKAAKTLQVAWRERQKQRIGEGGPAALSSPASLTRMSLFQGMGGGSAVGFGSNRGDSMSALAVDGGSAAAAAAAAGGRSRWTKRKTSITAGTITTAGWRAAAMRAARRRPAPACPSASRARPKTNGLRARRERRRLSRPPPA
ncbi:unnamed protein product [Ectocarpus sp. 12 AP-2014]